MKVALQLFHGRRTPDEPLDGWGSQGPVFLVDYVHVTYWWDLKLGIDQPTGDGDLRRVGDLVFYDGVFYGDWSVFPASLAETEENLRRRIVPFDHVKATVPESPGKPAVSRGVIVEVRAGVAEVVAAPEDVEVEIIDRDIESAPER